MVGPKRITPEVEELARRAVELEPTNAEYLWYLLTVRMALRENDAALRTADQLLTHFPEDARAHAMRAVLRADRAATEEEFAQVEEDLNEAAKQEAAEATRRYAAGLLALRRNRGADAARELREAARLDPETDVTYYKLSLAERMAGNEKAALQAFELYERRRKAKHLQAEAISDIAQQPDDPERYHKAIELFQKQSLGAQAEAIRREARRRFGSRKFP